MQTLITIADLRQQIAQWRRAGERIAFVPTMGNLHAGHLALVRRGQELAERVVVSIFVNPLQFGPDEDFERYPRTLDADRRQLEALHTDVLYTPTVEDMYPGGMEQAVTVDVPALSDILCGASRPGHFAGVATVVARLFNQVQPDVAVFGEKDYQQLAIIRRMVQELAFPVAIEGVPTRREPDGLAMSSRNQYLSVAERAIAPRLYATLQATAARLTVGDTDFAGLAAAGRELLESGGLRPDYYEIRGAKSLASAQAGQPLVVLAAAWLGQTRLIDNLVAPAGAAAT